MGAVSPGDRRPVHDSEPREPLRTDVTRPLVVLVEDEADLTEMVDAYLSREGFRVLTAGDARSGTAVLREHGADLLVLDLGLPDCNGLDFLRGVRAGKHLPVIILTGWSSERDRVVGLELGADDYMIKPFSLAELAARIRAVLRRSTPAVADPVLRHGPLCVDTASREVTVDGAPMHLTPLEYELLAFLAAAPRQVFSAGQLLPAMRGFEPGRGDVTSVIEHVYRLRRKLIAAGARRPRIVTVRGAGYRLDP
ncbi:DNA-binding response regulator [Lentzea sp. NBRC 105346]|uniref:response regulator transcription factor n=1 Tax=Lentzea sp. NBRC 105346 TaxID=3032205 RepID=UPI0024A1CF1E|nr:response regulator transcription factor [Lentzea sp. NBRC 105346]GLZ31814.1 DNA-binding response regulator [Lentzea sp. NBRC 105346]